MRMRTVKEVSRTWITPKTAQGKQVTCNYAALEGRDDSPKRARAELTVVGARAITCVARAIRPGDWPRDWPDYTHKRSCAPSGSLRRRCASPCKACSDDYIDIRVVVNSLLRTHATDSTET